MNSFDLIVDSTAQPNTVTSVTAQQSDLLPVSGLHQAVAPISVFNYLSVAAILLVLAGMVGVTVRSAGLKLKPKKSSQVEMLERIWNMSPQDIKD